MEKTAQRWYYGLIKERKGKNMKRKLFFRVTACVLVLCDGNVFRTCV